MVGGGLLDLWGCWCRNVLRNKKKFHKTQFVTNFIPDGTFRPSEGLRGLTFILWTDI